MMDVKKLMNRILEKRGVDDREVVILCTDLLQIAKKGENAKRYAFAYYYLSEAYVYLSQREQAYQNLLKGIHYQRIAMEEELLARSYNLLGIIYYNRGCYAISMEQFSIASQICKNSTYYYINGLINLNISNIYLHVGEYQRAQNYLKIAVDNFVIDGRDKFCYSNVVYSYTMLAYCCCFLGEEKQAAIYKEQLEKILARRDIELYQDTPTFFYLAIVSDMLGEEESKNRYIKSCMDLSLNKNIILDYIQDYLLFARMLLKSKRYSELLKLFQLWSEWAENEIVPNLEIELLQLELDFYKETGDTDKYKQGINRFYEVFKRKKEEDRKAIIRTLEMHFTIEKIKSDNEILLKKSQLDSMTGLANREALNKHMEQTLEKARKNHTMMGVELLDIDYFKQYNDLYGHMAGDQCILAVSDILKSISNHNIFCARYGGDEFVVIYYNKTDEEILVYMREIQNQLKQKRICHEGSFVSKYVTISQGVRNSIPTIENRVWDYLYAADKALYDVKEKKRGSMKLLHRPYSY